MKERIAGGVRAEYTGIADEYARKIGEIQLKDTALWEKFIEVFRTDADVQDQGWRCEYWGKMMRGGCLTYLYTRDEELYRVLEKAVCGLLDVQDADGRFSTYDKEHEFSGWDVWGRKYVLIGAEYFYSICRSSALRARLLGAMCRHADYITEKIGEGEGRIPITNTSSWWGGVNSASILEPFVQLYKMTGQQRYLRFAESVISSGGCRDGNLIEAVQSGKMPCEFPEVKAYETMSFFEGLLAYGEVTGEEKYLAIVRKFIRSVAENEITVIGCAGCTHELFDGAAARQTEYSEGIMQETCVTVTWMRLLARFWERTGEGFCAEAIERSARNALYGSINVRGCRMYSMKKKKTVDPVPFDSYSPLLLNRRGRGVGGYKEFADGSYYGCCACIGAAGTALYPLLAVSERQGAFYINFYMNGRAEGKTPSGERVIFECKGDPSGENFAASIRLQKPEVFSVYLRIPAGGSSVALCEGESPAQETGYYLWTRSWRDGDKIVLKTDVRLKEIEKNGKAAYTYGPFVLARDEQKEAGADIARPFTPLCKGEELAYSPLAAKDGEQLRLLLKTTDGEVLLTDYASCGKDWEKKDSRISVWFERESAQAPGKV